MTTDFAAGSISSHGGLVMLRAAERRLGLAETLADCIRKRGARSNVLHPEKCSDGIPNAFRSRFDVSVSEMGISDTKTGPRTISLSPEAVQVLAAVLRMDGTPYVIPGKIKGKAGHPQHSRQGV